MRKEFTDEELEVIERHALEREIRLPVLRFARAMEEVLRRNDYKDGWDNCSDHYLNERLNEEVKEYNKAHEPEEVIDVANFCMMIWDNRMSKVFPQEGM